MVIGIPRAFLYYKYGILWETFFKESGFDVILSPQTNRQILSEGLKASIDESCLPAKIYLGHVAYLIGKCDYILIPRFESFGKNELVCTKLNAVYDIVKTTFYDKLIKSGTNLLDYDVNVLKGKTEEKGIIRMAKTLGVSHSAAEKAYFKGLNALKFDCEIKCRKQKELLASACGRLKIFVAGHAYNIYDPLIGGPIVKYLEKLGASVILANECDNSFCAGESKKITEKLYWTFNKEIVGAIELYDNSVDGTVFITAFPCGPDSLVNELVIRKKRGTPKLNLIVDELQSESGLLTRLESFVDILSQRRALNRQERGAL